MIRVVIGEGDEAKVVEVDDGQVSGWLEREMDWGAWAEGALAGHLDYIPDLDLFLAQRIMSLFAPDASLDLTEHDPEHVEGRVY